MSKIVATAVATGVIASVAGAVPALAEEAPSVDTTQTTTTETPDVYTAQKDAQQNYDTAKSAADQANEKLTTDTQKHTDLQNQAKDKTDAVISDSAKNVTQADKNASDNLKATEDTQAQVDNTQEEHTQAENDLATKTDVAESDLSQVENDKTTADSAVDTAQSEADQANAANDAAQKEQTKAEETKSEADQSLANAENNVDTAQKNVDTAQEAVDNLSDPSKLKDTADVAKTEADSAKSNLDEATSYADEAKEDVDSASQNVTNATEAHDKAVSDVTTANDNLKKAKQALKDANTVLDEANTAVTNAQKAVDAAQAAYDSAASGNTSTIDVDTAKKNLDAAKSELDTCTTILSAAKNTKESAESNLISAKQDVAYAQSVVNGTKYLQDHTITVDSDDTIANSSLGFFKWLASLDSANEGAVKVLTDSSYTGVDTNSGENETFLSKTNIGESTDATSLENLGMAIKYIIAGNQYRANDPYFTAANNTNPLKISTLLMALGEVNANWSYTYSNLSNPHAVMNGEKWNVGENIAGGSNFYIPKYDPSDGDDLGTNSGSVDWDNPYDAWYLNERYNYVHKNILKDTDTDNYHQYNGGQTGHYTNLMGVSYAYTATGFGYCSTSRSGDIASQVVAQEFGTTSGYNGLTTHTYDAEEFLDMYNAYYLAVQKAQAQKNLADAQAAYDSAVASGDSTAIEDAGYDLYSAKTDAEYYDNIVANTQSQYNNTNSIYTTLKSKYDTAVSNYDSAQKAYDQANTAYQQAQTDYTNAQSGDTTSSAKAALDTAKANLTKAQDDQAAAQSQADKAAAEVTAAQAALVSAQSAETTTADTLASFQSKLQEKTDTYNTLKAKQDAAQAAYDSAKSAYDNAEAVYQDAITGGNVAKKNLADAKAKLIDANDALAKVQFDVESAKTALDNAVAKASATAKTALEKNTILSAAKATQKTATDKYNALMTQHEDYVNAVNRVEELKNKVAELKSKLQSLKDAQAGLDEIAAQWHVVDAIVASIPSSSEYLADPSILTDAANKLAEYSTTSIDSSVKTAVDDYVSELNSAAELAANANDLNDVIVADKTAADTANSNLKTAKANLDTANANVELQRQIDDMVAQNNETADNTAKQASYDAGVDAGITSSNETLPKMGDTTDTTSVAVFGSLGVVVAAVGISMSRRKRMTA